jgi:acyl-CoA thioester hydrolase
VLFRSNNAVVSTFCETGRVAFMRAARAPGDTGRVNWVVARVAIDYLDEMHFPGTVDIGTRLVEIRRSSMTLVQGLFHAGACCAVAEAVAVRFDPIGRGALPIDEALRERLSAVGRGAGAD